MKTLDEMQVDMIGRAWTRTNTAVAAIRDALSALAGDSQLERMTWERMFPLLDPACQVLNVLASIREIAKEP